MFTKKILKCCLFAYFMQVGMCGCNTNANKDSHEENSNGITVIEWNSLKDVDDSFFEKMQVSFVQLQTNDSCMLTAAYDNKMAKDFIFIRNQGNIYEFKIDGTFVRQIGSKGHAKNEYIDIFSYCIDKDSDMIEVVDFGGRKVVKYDFDNNFISSTRFPFKDIQYSVEVAHAGKDRYIVRNMNSINSPYNYTLVGKNDGLIKPVVPYIVVGKINANANMCMLEMKGGSYLPSDMSDTIFFADNDGVCPKYVINGPLKHSEAKDFEGKEYEVELLARNEALERGLSVGIENLKISDSHLFFTYNDSQNTYAVIYNIATKEGYKYMLQGKSTVLEMFSTLRLSHYGSSFVGQLPVLGKPEEYKELCKIPNFLETYSKRGEGDNPILAIVTFP